MSSDKIQCFTVAVYSLSLMIMFISLASILPFCWSLDISLYHRLEPQIGVPFDRIGIFVCVCVCFESPKVYDCSILFQLL